MKKRKVKDAETEEPYEDAHEIALEFLKQLITLSSGVLALSAAFIDNFMPVALPQILLLVFSWSSLAFSIYFGLQAISAIVQSRLVRGLNWADGLGRKYTGASKYLFIIGIIFFAVFAFVSFLGNSGIAP